MPVADGEPGTHASVAEAAGKWLAVFGSLVAVGQAGSTWVSGYWQAETDRQKAGQELELARVKERSELAKEYLQVILDKDTTPANRATLLTALSEIDGHPLQHWARTQYEIYQTQLAHLETAFRAQDDAAQMQDGAKRELAQLQAALDAANSQFEIDKDDPVRRAAVQNQRMELSRQVGQVTARLSVASVKLDDTNLVIATAQRGASGQGATPRAGTADAITALSGKITVDLLLTILPERARANAGLNAPYLKAAFEEFKIADKAIAASILATIAVENPTLDNYEEPASEAVHYEGRLGNDAPGDGVRYRGRGLLGITGKANYAAMSARLGLGTGLVDSPEDAKSPEISARVLVAWFADRQATLQPALDRGDLGAVRRAVAGSPTRLIEFKAAYVKVLSSF